MLTVSHDLAAVESQLASCELLCPDCSGRLRPWGFARERTIREGVPVVNSRLIPRRGRCRGCGATHVLLPGLFAARRADAAAVIAQAIELNIVGGLGHRSIAAVLDRPATTVRGWIRTFATNAPAVCTAFTTRVHRATAQALGFWPAPSPSPGANALGMLLAHAAVLAHEHATGAVPVVSVPWHYAALAGHGPWFFSATGWPDRAQHEPALTWKR